MKIVIYVDLLYQIGGIETWIYCFCKHFENKDITVVYNRADTHQIMRIGKYANVLPSGEKIECDVLIIPNYDFVIPSEMKAKKIIQMIHADWRGITKLKAWSNFKWERNKIVDELVTVSISAHDSVLELFNEESKVIYNPLDYSIKKRDKPPDGKLRFITLSRATAEKGINRLIEMALKFNNAKVDFEWLLCATLSQDPGVAKKIKRIPQIKVIKPALDNRNLIPSCHYLVQLSDCESFCYSAYEALQYGVPVILTRYSEAYNTVEEDINGFLVDFDLHDLNIEKICNKIPQNVMFKDRFNPSKWDDLLKW